MNLISEIKAPAPIQECLAFNGSGQRQPRDSVQSNLAIFDWLRTTELLDDIQILSAYSLDRLLTTLEYVPRVNQIVTKQSSWSSVAGNDRRSHISVWQRTSLVFLSKVYT